MNAELGRRLRQARLELGLSGTELARRIGKSQPYISDLERGQRTPSLSTLAALAQALGRPLSYFLGADEEGEALSWPERTLPTEKANEMTLPAGHRRRGPAAERGATAYRPEHGPRQAGANRPPGHPERIPPGAGHHVAAASQSRFQPLTCGCRPLPKLVGAAEAPRKTPAVRAGPPASPTVRFSIRSAVAWGPSVAGPHRRQRQAQQVHGARHFDVKLRTGGHHVFAALHKEAADQANGRRSIKPAMLAATASS
jgi:Predicted transcriptional regulators